MHGRNGYSGEIWNKFLFRNTVSGTYPLAIFNFDLKNAIKIYSLRKKKNKSCRTLQITIDRKLCAIRLVEFTRALTSLLNGKCFNVYFWNVLITFVREHCVSALRLPLKTRRNFSEFRFEKPKWLFRYLKYSAIFFFRIWKRWRSIRYFWFELSDSQ